MLIATTNGVKKESAFKTNSSYNYLSDATQTGNLPVFRPCRAVSEHIKRAEKIAQTHNQSIVKTQTQNKSKDDMSL